ncbi:hypothetical protein NVT87_13530 [Acinetobacter radioresistens]|jgi:hypothetical protein|uniref:Uncharacterized protein n=1 Tax=Acinetobacter radioresistens SK82 TaxID=596318 RepID=A0ABP2GLL3_ACIRA|nr:MULTISPECIES: hypothetical protein [Acinetobacter]EET82085.1 hypothetical protein ACIRA0001_3259 [Acinetobacter radioresistens SK82]ENV84590.1 hypothetical protein F940_02610 [Acinetobacter radioresistens NIPH 2130]EXB72949.1 hypothetical protein J550_1396 [Acinetobacter sp. 230853]EXB77543.1 hypothetical protein J538_3287 [Acinetobacter sp. 272263]EXE54384.1 hypothetical protein J579_3193 [Acinetobacter sp. 1239920]
MSARSTYYIGGVYNGQVVEPSHLGSEEILKFIEEFTAQDKETLLYKRVQINKDGTIKSFYLLEGAEPADYKELILNIWLNVPVDVYGI